jgi:hypothetical protein
MDEKSSNWMKKFGDKKMSFCQKIAKISIFEKKIRHLAILRQ